MGKHTRNAFLVTASFIIVFVVTTYFVDRLSGEANFFKTLTVSIIITWVVALVGYYAWALYFYNINYGWSEEDWKEYYKNKSSSNPTAKYGEPKRNPHDSDSLGLPPGTIRGTVALTLLIGGVSMTIAALSFGDRLKDNELLIDNFDFFKKAFLMMIAFYFGTKSLEILQDKSGNKKRGDGNDHDDGDSNGNNNNGGAGGGQGGPKPLPAAQGPTPTGAVASQGATAVTSSTESSENKEGEGDDDSVVPPEEKKQS